MAYEMHSVLIGALSMTTGEKVMPAYGGGFESYLTNVITPIYRVIYEVLLQFHNSSVYLSSYKSHFSY